jgi:hypothetical protein
VRTNATTDARWVHHALYLTTSVLTVSATVALLLGPPEGAKQGRAGWFLLPALAPLAAIPFLGSSAAHRRRHTLVALIPAPFYAMSAFSAASVLNKKRSS